jgi:AraC-like DNA-binding protein
MIQGKFRGRGGMSHSARPAVDPGIVSAYGVSKSGQPLSYNRAPAADLSAWIARLSVTKIDLSKGHVLSCGLFSDTAGVRVQVSGSGRMDLADQPGPASRVMFFGPQGRLMTVRHTSSFVSVGILLRPSACTALMGPHLAQYVDKAVPVTPAIEQLVLAALTPEGSAEDWLVAIEDLVRWRIGQLRGAAPDAITAQFEEIAFRDPAMSIDQAAREIGVDRRRLERLVVRDFGMPPKQVLKRARALDMASHLRGVADPDEADALALRYYDESHLIREFAELFGKSPRQFGALPQPLLTLTLEARQARRLEMLNRLAPGAKRPWE